MSARYEGRRRFTPGPTTLLALFPAAWRRRYGDELDALILDMHADGRNTGTRMRADLLRSAARERLRGGGDPSRRIRGGGSLVLWAWALFVIGGAIVQRVSEHWQGVAGGNPAADTAFSAFTVIAVVVAVVIAGAIALTLPAVVRLLRDGGWARLRGRVLAAGGLTAAVIPATVALATWGHHLTTADRSGHDHLYSAAFLVWGALGASFLLAWTAVGARIASHARFGSAVLRAHSWLAPGVALAMSAMTPALLVWWAVVAADSPAALTGGSTVAHPSPLVPQLVLAAVLMVIATGLATVGALRAGGARAEI